LNALFSEISSHWLSADGWTNGAGFNVGWRQDHADLIDGQLVLRLDNSPCLTDTALCSGKAYASGEYRSQATYHYGVYSVDLQAVASPGVVTSFFTYTGLSEGDAHHEIDIEILGQNPNQLQLNYYAGSDTGHEVLIELGFDASLALHTYSFDWQSDKIIWFVDGIEVHRATTGTMPSIAGKIMMNTWAVDASLASWAGSFNYLAPLHAYYDNVTFTDSTTQETTYQLVWPY